MRVSCVKWSLRMHIKYKYFMYYKIYSNVHLYEVYTPTFNIIIHIYRRHATFTRDLRLWRALLLPRTCWVFLADISAFVQKNKNCTRVRDGVGYMYIGCKKIKNHRATALLCMRRDATEDEWRRLCDTITTFFLFIVNVIIIVIIIILIVTIVIAIPAPHPVFHSSSRCDWGR